LSCHSDGHHCFSCGCHRAGLCPGQLLLSFLSLGYFYEFKLPVLRQSL
jgi:hypothetical protein